MAKRRKKESEVAVYEYRIVRPSDEFALLDLCQRSRETYLRMMNLENEARRRRFELGDHDPRVAGARAAALWLRNERDQCTATIKKINAKTRTQKASAHLRPLQKQLKEQAAFARQRERDITTATAIYSRLVYGQPDLSDLHAQHLRARRVEFRGLNGATTDLSHRAIEAARKTPLTREGRLTLLASPPSDGAIAADQPKHFSLGAAELGVSKRSSRYAPFAIRAGAGDNVHWFKFSAIVHRPLPAYPTRAVVRRKRIGADRYGWFVEFTVERQRKQAPAIGAVAFDYGWRKRPNGLRAGFFLGSDGSGDECIIPDRILRMFDRAESIRSYRDRLRDRVARRSGVHRQTSCERLRALPRTPLLEQWHHRDRHLHQYEYGTRQRAQRARREIYRTIAARLAATYRDCLVENDDKRRHAHFKDERENPVARTNRVRVAPYEFTAALQNAFGPDRFHTVKASYTSCMCSDCGHVNDIGAAMEFECQGCGARHDRDENACRNLLGAPRAPRDLMRDCERSAETEYHRTLRERAARKADPIAAE